WENRAYVRMLLRQRQPAFAAALSSAEQSVSCPADPVSCSASPKLRDPGMRMLAVTWTNDARGRLLFWLHAAVRHGIWPSVDDQLGITPRASSDSSGYISKVQNRVFAAQVPFSSDTPT